MPRIRTDRLRPGDVLERGALGTETVVWVRHKPDRPICEVLVTRANGTRVVVRVAPESLHTVTERPSCDQ